VEEGKPALVLGADARYRSTFEEPKSSTSMSHAPPPDRKERLAAALRENLKRRKRQMRERAAEPRGEAPHGTKEPAPGAGPDTKD